MNRLVNSFSAKMRWISGVLLIGAVALVVVDVILRRWFALPIKGSYEVTQLLIGIGIALSIAYTQTQRGHISIEVLQFSKQVQDVLDNIGRFISLVVYSLLAWQIGVVGADFWKVGQVSDTLRFPIFPFYWGLSLGCALMSLLLLLELVNSLSRAEQK